MYQVVHISQTSNMNNWKKTTPGYHILKPENSLPVVELPALYTIAKNVSDIQAKMDGNNLYHLMQLMLPNDHMITHKPYCFQYYVKVAFIQTWCAKRE
eukprot:c10295_g1_i1 orf=3-293(-)